MFRCRTRPSSPTASVTACLLLSILNGCGRIGVEILPFELDLEDAGDATAVDQRDGAVDVEVGPVADARVDAVADAEVELDAGFAPEDAAVSEDAAQLPVETGPGDAGGDAAAARDASAPRDAALADAGVVEDAGLPADAGVVVDADLPPVPAGLRILVDNPAGATLRDYPVRVLLDTQALITQGKLASDCSNLRVFGGDRCTEARSFFLPDDTCNSSATELWVRVPELLAGAREVLSITFGTDGEASNGNRVFPFFDGFDGSALDTTRWTPHGNGTLSVSGGLLRTQNIMLLQSVPGALTAGNSLLRIRFAVRSTYDTYVELGAGTVFDDSVIWAYGRDWDGVSFATHDTSGYVINGPIGSACNDPEHGPITSKLSDQPWVDHPPASESFLTADFSYALQGSSVRASLRTSRGFSLDYTSPANCSLPSSLPVVVTLDHLNEAGSPVQRIDYVYVRPTVRSEPTTSVQTDSSYACGTEP